MDGKFVNSLGHCTQGFLLQPRVALEVMFHIPQSYRDAANERQDIPARLWVNLCAVFEQEHVRSIRFQLTAPGVLEGDRLLVRTYDASPEWIERMMRWINDALDRWALDLEEVTRSPDMQPESEREH